VALTPQTRAAQAATQSLAGVSVQLRVPQGAILAAINFPTAQERTSQIDLLTDTHFKDPALRNSQANASIYAKPGLSLRVSQADVLAYVRGRIQNPKLRAWTFTLDGHDFYVLRLGMDLTLVFDLTTEQWVDWDAFSETYWPVNCGINWVGGTGILQSDLKTPYGSNVLVGDDSYGLLWFLDPTLAYDQHPEPANPTQQINFPRVLQGQVPMTGRENLPCYAVWLTTDMGNPGYLGAGVLLEISDDAGNTYQDCGTVTVTAGVYDPELAWTSLGQIEAPGRLFRVTDDGAVARIDNMEMNDPDDK
jgi:hypothetical protein